MGDVLDRLKAALADRYTVERELGSGGMAVVYLAEDLRHERRVAIKVLRPELTSVVAAERFLREIKLTASLAHPHVLPLLDSGEADGLLYYVMPYLEGESLREKLNREKRLPVDDAVRIAHEVADALRYAHGRNLLHRDIKPENILLAEGHAVVADFGIARALSEAGGDRLTDTGVSIGTPTYMSPEQAAGEREANEASDLYSLACVLYEMLTGEPPINETSQQAAMSRKLLGDFRPARIVRGEVPAAVDAAVSKALATEPADRFSTAGEFAEALEPVSRPAGHRVGLARVIGLSAAASVVVLAVAYFLMLLGRTGSTANQLTAPVEATRVAVFPFAFRGGGQFEYLGEGVGSLLATALDGAGDLRVVDNRALLSLIAQRRTESLSPEETRQIAQQLGAGRFVLGDIVEVEGRLQVNAVFYSPGNGRERASASVEGPADQIFQLVNDLAVRLVVGEPGAPGERLTQVASVTTESRNALKAYLQGEAHFLAGRHSEAARSFERAVALDSTFALAWYRLSVVGDYVRVYPSALRAAEHAVRYASRLSERDNQLLQAYLAFVRGAGGEAERRYASIVSAYPSAVHAWEQLGEVRFHYGPMFGQSKTQSQRAWQRVLFFEPNHRGALLHLARIATLEGDLAELDSLTYRLEHLDSETNTPEPRALRAFLIGDAAAQAEVVDHWPRPARSYELQMIALHTVNLSGAKALAKVGARLAESADQRVLHQLHVAALTLAQGQWREALISLDSAASLDSALALEYRALLLLSPFLELPQSELERLDSELGAWQAGTALSDVADHNGIHEQLKLYLRGVLSSRLGHFAIAEEYASALEDMPGPEETGSLHADLARSVRAQAAWNQGRREEALELLEQSERVWNYNRTHMSAFFSQALERYLQAEYLEQLGRTGEALEWYETIAQVNVTDLIYLAPSHLRRAQMYERLGERDEAVRHYARFIELWQDADPELQPRVEAARRAIEALSPDA